MDKSTRRLIDDFTRDVKVLEDACVALYMSIHVSELASKTKPVVDLWKIGQEIYSRGRYE